MAKIKKEKSEEIPDAISAIRKKWGEGSILKLSQSRLTDVPVFKTNTDIDIVTGVGGLPFRRIIEIFGPEGSGKSSMSLHIISQAQQQGYNCAFLDTEHAMDLAWAQKLGVDIKKIWFSQPDCGEEGIDIVETLIQNDACQVIVVDSVTGLVPKAELEGDFDESVQLGGQASLMARAMKRLTGMVSKKDVCLIFLNQVRVKIDMGRTFNKNLPPQEVSTGGRALKFFSSVRLFVTKAEPMKTGSKIVGTGVRVRCVKNKVAPPFLDCYIGIDFNEGRVGDFMTTKERLSELFGSAIDYAVITKDSDGYHWDDEVFSKKSEIMTLLEKKTEEARLRKQVEQEKVLE